LLTENFNQGRHLIWRISFFVPKGQLHNDEALSGTNMLVSESNLHQIMEQQ
jgi:hypothetical protein